MIKYTFSVRYILLIALFVPAANILTTVSYGKTLNLYCSGELDVRIIINTEAEVFGAQYCPQTATEQFYHASHEYFYLACYYNEALTSYKINRYTGKGHIAQYTREYHRYYLFGELSVGKRVLNTPIVCSPAERKF